MSPCARAVVIQVISPRRMTSLLIEITFVVYWVNHWVHTDMGSPMASSDRAQDRISLRSDDWRFFGLPIDGMNVSSFDAKQSPNALIPAGISGEATRAGT
jgi:hypothetical protein